MVWPNNNIYTIELFDSKGREISSTQMYKAFGFSLYLNDEFLGFFDFPKKTGKVDKLNFINKTKTFFTNQTYYKNQTKLKRALEKDFRKLEKIVEQEEALELKKNEFVFTRSDKLYHSNFYSKTKKKSMNSFNIASVFTPSLDLQLNLEKIEKELISSFSKLNKVYKTRYDDNLLNNEIYVRIVVPPEDASNNFASVISVKSQYYKRKEDVISATMKALRNLLSKKGKKENYKRIYMDSRISLLGYTMEAIWPADVKVKNH